MNASAIPLPTPVLEIEGLKTHFFTRDGVVRAVDGLSFSVGPGETLAIVGQVGDQRIDPRQVQRLQVQVKNLIPLGQ